MSGKCGEKSSSDVLNKIINLFSTSLIPIFVSLLFSVYFLNLDTKFPQYPINSSDLYIDCTSIFINHIENMDNDSKISFSFNVETFQQFPASKAISMINIDITTGCSTSSYSYNDYHNKSINETSFSFEIFHPYTGRSLIDVKCGPVNILKREIEIEAIETYSHGYSRLYRQVFATSGISEACYLNKSILLASTNDATHDKMFTSKDSSLNVDYEKKTTKEIAEKNKIFYDPNENDDFYGPNVIILDANPTLGYKKIMDVMIPLWIYSRGLISSENQTLILHRNQFNQKDVIKPIFKGKVIGNDENICFLRGIVLASSESKKYNIRKEWYYERGTVATLYDHLNFIGRIQGDVLQGMRDFYYSNEEFSEETNNEMIKIVFDQKSYKFAKTIQTLYPAVISSVIDDNDPIKVTAQKMMDASVFVFSDIYSLMYSVFMRRGMHVISYDPEGLNCAGTLSSISINLGLRFHQLRKDKYPKIELYNYLKNLPNAEYPNLGINAINRVFRSIMLSL